jgi:hypothetical protein
MIVTRKCDWPKQFSYVHLCESFFFYEFFSLNMVMQVCLNGYVFIFLGPCFEYAVMGIQFWYLIYH